MSMRIRIVPIDDYDPNFLKSLIEIDGDAFGFRNLTPTTLESFMRFGKVFVGYEGQELVAVGEFIRDWYDTENAYVVGLAVRPEKQNRGYGTRLLKSALEHLRAEGFSSVMLHVSPSNLGAMHVYKNLGFQRVSLHKNEYGDGKEQILMKKVLQG